MQFDTFCVACSETCLIYTCCWLVYSMYRPYIYIYIQIYVIVVLCVGVYVFSCVPARSWAHDKSFAVFACVCGLVWGGWRVGKCMVLWSIHIVSVSINLFVELKYVSLMCYTRRKTKIGVDMGQEASKNFQTQNDYYLGCPPPIRRLPQSRATASWVGK